jgi:hypothetical protein
MSKSFFLIYIYNKILKKKKRRRRKKRSARNIVTSQPRLHPKRVLSKKGKLTVNGMRLRVHQRCSQKVPPLPRVPNCKQPE